MYFIILLLIQLSSCAICYEKLGANINISIPFDKIEVKRNNQIIGSIPAANTITEIYSMRIFAEKLSGNSWNVFAKANNINNAGDYQFIANKTHHNRTLTFSGSEIPPRKINTVGVGLYDVSYVCDDNGRMVDRKILWYIDTNGILDLKLTTRNVLYKNQITGFTKLYCEWMNDCKTSDILYSNETQETLTWESDFRLTSTATAIPATATPIPATGHTKIPLINPTPTTSTASEKSLSMTLILLFCFK